ncbi:MAG: 3-dehydroquinate synthase [Verrucomicrobiales bacterium]|nr:3-dehydroquinate synthase [Verrucomicrobiales bacterium]
MSRPPKLEKISSIEALKSARETRGLLVAAGALERTAEFFKTYFPNRPAAIIADAITFKVAGRKVREILEKNGVKCVEPFIFTDPKFYASYNYVDELEAALKAHDAVPVAVGSGSINDVSKLASHKVGRQYMSVGTAASMDGYTASGASITYNDSKQTFGCPAPLAVLADTEILRQAPREMTAAGYADLSAKLTAGADWILADALGIEALEPKAWQMAQAGLRDALGNPDAISNRDADATGRLVEALMLGGFSMQWSNTSRPASGAEHQFSHLWDMQHHTHNGKAPSHGFKVGVATVTITALYEYLLTEPIDKLDVEACCAKWPSLAEFEKQIRTRYASENFVDKVVEEFRAKYPTTEVLRDRLNKLRAAWPQLREDLRQQLIPSAQLKSMLHTVGAPVEPEQIGITRSRLRDSFVQAWYIRRRFTVLDVIFQTQLADQCLEHMFGVDGSLRA